MSRTGCRTRIGDVVLIWVLACAGLPGPAAGDPSAVLSGRVLAADRTPLAGVQVHVGDARSAELRRSVPTGADGSFVVSGLPASTYELAVESGRGLYLADGSVRLAPGEARTVQVALTALAAGPQDAARQAKVRRVNWWNNPLTATLVVLGSAILVGIVVDNATDDDDMSPSNP